jgi:hypothetical protein
MRLGDFSAFAPIKDPLAPGTFFAGNQIPLARISTPALKAQAFYPLPNRAGANNLYLAPPNPSDWDNPMFKIDQRFGSRDSMSFRYLKRYNRSVNPFAGSTTGFGQTQQDHQLLIGLKYTRMFSPATVNETRLAYTRTPTHNVPFYQARITTRCSACPADPPIPS